MSGAFLFQWVLVGPDKAENVAALNDVALCRLTGWLAQDYQEDGPSGEVLGICLVEGAARFAAGVAERKRNPWGLEEMGTGLEVPATRANGEGFL